MTPDSFYDGGRYLSEAAVLHQADKMISEGADFLDVGGYSSRPGAAEITVQEEIRRILPVISAIVKRFPGTIISIDTFRSAVVEAAAEAGATLVNDISGGNLDAGMFEVVARLKVPYVLMHMRGNPQTMNSQTQYGQIIKEMIDYFHTKLSALQPFAVKDTIVDPGFGFSKTIAQNFNVLQNLEKFSILGKPVLVGLSRKSMIWRTLEIEPTGALNGTTALNTLALLKGADILRVHDVKQAREVVKLFNALQLNVGS